ncbi:Pycsar system effector family protein [Adhaeribacter soli]|uniref:Pycsar effector protein domain-containing protein n=1 Tax=Adhaeribacter soli TaxID=2607655 RepID=A0A5N1IM54_9BACT|nr:Pycsar system effector family protein [Adhaeribacter soli]KAA9331152.1 hypothetical protein F0P94_14755 [Adhaeribacter soli]
MEHEELRFAIARFDHYYDSVNNKGQFYLGMNTFLLSAYGACFIVIREKEILSNPGIKLYLIVLSIICFLSISVTLFSILPYLGSSNLTSGKSYIYYQDIASISLSEYKLNIHSANKEKVLDDLIIQSHSLALGLKFKFKCLKWAGILIFLEFIIIPFFFYNLLQIL